CANPAFVRASLTAAWFMAAVASHGRRTMTTRPAASKRAGAPGVSPAGSMLCGVSGGRPRAARTAEGSTSTGVAPSACPRLTFRAVVGRAAADGGALDDGAAGVAGFAGAAEDLDVHVLLALVALAIDVVFEAGATVFDSAFKDGAGGVEEPLHGRG